LPCRQLWLTFGRESRTSDAGDDYPSSLTTPPLRPAFILDRFGVGRDVMPF
jgi:hypothetical protein